jgi:hypothetical protein
MNRNDAARVLALLPRFAKNFSTAGWTGRGFALEASAVMPARTSAAMPKRTASRQRTACEIVFAAVTAEVPAQTNDVTLPERVPPPERGTPDSVARMPGGREQSLPAPGPPQERTAGQLVGEGLRLYGRRFWKALPLGLGPVAVAIAINALPSPANLVFAATGGSLVLTLCYVAACLLAHNVEPTRQSVATAVVAGFLVFAPVPFLTRILIFPAFIWLAFFGLSVPVALYERKGLQESLARALVLARADFVHALGSLAALGIVGFVSALALSSLLIQFGDQARSTAALLPLFLVSPLLLLGAALLYFDQAARVAPDGLRKGLTAPSARRGK